jgi:hypothetical protein
LRYQIIKIPLSAILNLSTILIFLKKVVHSHGRVMLHGGPTKLKNQSWRHDAPLFQSGLPKIVDFGKIANDHLEILHEGFGKDFNGHGHERRRSPESKSVEKSKIGCL